MKLTKRKKQSKKSIEKKLYLIEFVGTDENIYDKWSLLNLDNIIARRLYESKIPEKILDKANKKALNWKEKHDDYNYDEMYEAIIRFLEKKGFRSIDFEYEKITFD